MAPFRFGVQMSRAPSLPAWRETARKLEDLGYSTMFMPDHLDDQFGPFVALTVAAEATRALNVGSLVFDNDYRNPVLLAKECATLDLASEGRLEVGLGAGWLRSDYERSGIAYEPPAVRVARLEEAARVVKALWANPRVEFEGRYYRLRGAEGLPRPHTSGGPPLIIGGGSRKVLEVAVRHAKTVGVNVSLAAGALGPELVAEATPARFAERASLVRQLAGPRLGELELQNLVFMASLGRPQALQAEEMSEAFGRPREEVAGSPAALLGTEDEIVETLEQRREEFGFSYIVWHEGEIESFAPVVARLSGR